MMMEQPNDSRQKFVSGVLPWVVAAVFLGLYIVTLNYGLSFSGLLHVSRVAGWTWQPHLDSPAYWLITYPLRFLPAGLIPLALNLFSAVCAALTLALLARSVALLPHDRTQEQRNREKSPFALLSIPKAWQPPVLAALVCGLQLTFWECATAATAAPPKGSSDEMFDLLLFAYVIRCLLEFRINQEQSWLSRCAFVYGVGMTNNWAMWGFLPLFLLAVFWTKGLNFFNLRFLFRMVMWGMAGLAFYLLLPALQSLADIASVPFWQGLKSNLGSQRQVLASLLQGRQTILLLSLTSILPVLLFSIRWSSYFGDESPMGAGLATFMFHVIHGLFLLACVWMALDPPLSPRNRCAGVPFLTFYYLGALVVGYLAGYFLLLSGVKSRDRSRRTPAVARLAVKSISLGVLTLVFVTPAAQIYRNLPQIRTTNSPMLGQYGALCAQSLPSSGAVILSDDSRRATILQATLARTGRLKDSIVLDTASLPWSEYHRFITKRFTASWPVEVARGHQQMLEPQLLNRMLGLLLQSNNVYYLHPSFGYYFESVYLEPHGLAYKVLPYSTNWFLPPPITREVLDENEAFWTKVEREILQPLKGAAHPRAANGTARLVNSLLARAHLDSEPNRDANAMTTFYSRALDYWGAELQRAGRLEQAAVAFRRACEVNPNNVVARINLACNTNLQEGRLSAVAVPKNIEDEFSKYRSWDQVVGENGPFDEPGYCYAQGRAFLQGANYRQAAYQFERCRALATNHLSARLLLAQLYVVVRRHDDALDVIKEIRSRSESLGVHRTNQADLLFVEASAYLAKNDLNTADSVVRSALEKYPREQVLMSTAAQVYMKYGQFSNALTIIEGQLKLSPDDPQSLISKGYACLQLGALDRAIPPLNRVLSLETNTTSELHNFAMLYRAIVHLRSDKLDAAQRDYETLQRAHTNSCAVYYGLGEIAYRRKDTNAAIHNYQLYLTNAPSNVEEIKFVTARLRELQPGSP